MINEILLVGYVGNDPEVKSSTGGDVVKFGLATNDVYKDRTGVTVKNTQWHKIVCFGQTGSLVQRMVKKGSLVLVKGRLDYYEYDSDNGKKQIASILCNTFRVLSGVNKQSVNDTSDIEDIFLTKTKDRPLDNELPVDCDDLPF